jgi:hypothetical protein
VVVGLGALGASLDVPLQGLAALAIASTDGISSRTKRTHETIVTVERRVLIDHGNGVFELDVHTAASSMLLLWAYLGIDHNLGCIHNAATIRSCGYSVGQWLDGRQETSPSLTQHGLRCRL